MIEALDQYHDHIRSDVFDMVPRAAGRVLDLGGGIGATGAALKQAHGATFVAVADLVADRSARGVDVAVSGNLEDPVFLRKVLNEQGPFDTILCLDVLEHLRDPWSVVDELRNGLNPGGVIVASIPNVSHYSLLFPLLFRGKFELHDAGILDRTHLRWFTRKTAIELMTRPGLKLESVSSWLGRKNKILKALTFGISERFTVMQYYIRVRKAG